MKNKKFIMYSIIILLIIFIIIIGYIVINNRKNRSIYEFIPFEEISEEQLRKTNISLYFENKENKEIDKEIVQIDSKELLNKPEEKLLNLLLKGPQNNNLNKLIPNETKIISTKIEKGILYITFSNEFNEINNYTEIEKNKIINSVKMTLTQLSEINDVKIEINENIE